MKVTLAKTAGFCFGVQRAVDMVTELLDQGEKISTLGPIIHNPHMVKRLEERGVRTLSSIDENPSGYRVVIRSHGVAHSVIEDMQNRGIVFSDATCPYVKKIHALVKTASDDGDTVLIAGDAKHPEVIGIVGHCEGAYHIFSNCEELAKISEENAGFNHKKHILLAQTTFNLLEWQKSVEFAKNVYTNIKIFDTICNATVQRQKEAHVLSKQSDLMVVIGGHNSSNTAKLAQICAENCPTILIEDANDLSPQDWSGKQSIGVTAGASTPAFIIKEVQTTMTDLNNPQDEMSFEEMLEQSFKTINSKEKVTAVVTNVAPNEIAVDIGTKHAGYVPMHEFTDDPNAKLEDLVKVGDELELMVLRVNDVEGTAMLSKKRLDAIAGFEKIVEAEEKDEILQGTVVDIVKGGMIVLTNGVRVFIPASQATASRGEPLEDLLRQEVSFKILETNRQRRRAVGSVRAVLREQRKELEEQFWQEVEVGKKYKGTVKSLTSYGAFVDLGGVDGMIHISELAWSRIKHPSEIVNVNDVVEVYIKDIDADNKKISLGYKKTEDNPWEVLAREYKVGDVVKVKVVSMTSFGAFAQVVPGVDGLIHISQISNERVNKPSDVLSIGQEVEVKITDIDFDRKRVSLSIRALLNAPEQAAPAVEEEENNDTEGEVVYSAGPENAE